MCLLTFCVATPSINQVLICLLDFAFVQVVANEVKLEDGTYAYGRSAASDDDIKALLIEHVLQGVTQVGKVYGEGPSTLYIVTAMSQSALLQGGGDASWSDVVFQLLVLEASTPCECFFGEHGHSLSTTCRRGVHRQWYWAANVQHRPGAA